MLAAGLATVAGCRAASSFVLRYRQVHQCYQLLIKLIARSLPEDIPSLANTRRRSCVCVKQVAGRSVALRSARTVRCARVSQTHEVSGCDTSEHSEAYCGTLRQKSTFVERV